ncbi:MAG: carbon storage regulator [Pirellulales bacterium]
MLVLSRKVEQQIQIGEGIVITILQVKGNQVRIGIEAPREVRVIRGELEPKNEKQAEPSAERVFPPVARNPRMTDEKQFTIVRRSLDSATAERVRPNELEADEVGGRETVVRDMELRLSRRSSMSALRGFVLPRR